mmetsp:Transcript_4061/g.9585  ORF Transcript_4061/g.9585 Transcript_4061/m.9585 type:complete len:131 (-) Transcript_4061:75-467(-)
MCAEMAGLGAGAKQRSQAAEPNSGARSPKAAPARNSVPCARVHPVSAEVRPERCSMTGDQGGHLAQGRIWSPLTETSSGLPEDFKEFGPVARCLAKVAACTQLRKAWSRPSARPPTRRGGLDAERLVFCL